MIPEGQFYIEHYRISNGLLSKEENDLFYFFDQFDIISKYLIKSL